MNGECCGICSQELGRQGVYYVGKKRACPACYQDSIVVETDPTGRWLGLVIISATLMFGLAVTVTCSVLM